MQPVHPVPGDPYSHEKSHPDPVERDFPTSIADVLGGPPNYLPKEGWADLHPKGTPTGIDLLKLRVREAAPPEWLRMDPKELAAIVGAWEKERAATVEEIIELDAHLESARSGIADLTDSLEASETLRLGAGREVERLRGKVADLEAKVAAAEAKSDIYSERLHEWGDHGVECIRQPVEPLDRRGPTTLTQETVDRIARAVAEEIGRRA